MGRKEKKEKKEKEKEKEKKNKRHSAGGRNGGDIAEFFCRGGGVLANLDFCEVEPWGGEREKVKSGGDRVIRLVEGGGGSSGYGLKRGGKKRIFYFYFSRGENWLL